jgi:hypothetical protein
MSSTQSELERIGREYRKAFDTVQSLLNACDLGTIPPYVFAIDRFDIKQLGELDRTLAKAERRRRQWRAALHAMVELQALEAREEDHPVVSAAAETMDPDDPTDSSTLNEATKSDMPHLDRFISVVQYARTVGCSYVDGGFQPVFKDPPDER